MTGVQMYKCTGEQVYRCPGVQVSLYRCLCTGVQVSLYRCTGVQVSLYRCTGVQVYRCTPVRGAIESLFAGSCGLVEISPGVGGRQGDGWGGLVHTCRGECTGLVHTCRGGCTGRTLDDTFQTNIFSFWFSQLGLGLTRSSSCVLLSLFYTVQSTMYYTEHQFAL